MAKRKSTRLYFVESVTVPPNVEYEAGKWYDNVSPEHAQLVGAAALPMTHADCDHFLLPDGRAVITFTKHVKAKDAEGKEYMRPLTAVELQPHACEKEE